MKTAITNFILTCAILVFGVGCITWTPDQNALLTTAASVAPQYAGQIGLVASQLSAPKPSKTASAVSLDGYTFKRTYRYKGSVCEGSDIAWTDAWERQGSAATDDISTPVTVNIPAVELPQDVSSSATDAPALTKDEQNIDRLTTAVEALANRKTKK